MFPYHDENETQRPAYVTLALIALCVLVWLLVQGAGATQPLAASVCILGSFLVNYGDSLQACEFPWGRT